MTLRFKRSQRYSEWLLAISVGQMSEPLLNISKLPLRIPGSPQSLIAILFLLLLLHSSTGGAVRRLVFCTC
jgi:hypothetical protein